MKKVAFYARVSSERQEKEDTIASQVAQLREFAARQNYEIVGEYRDDGFSGDLLARPDLDRLRNDARLKRFDTVLILSPDRLARKWMHGEVIADDLRRQGVSIEYLNHKDDGSEEAKLFLGIQGLFGQYEKVKIIERSRRGRLYSAQIGRLVTGRAPFGYRYIIRSGQQPGRFEINGDEAEIVRLIFTLCAREKLGFHRISKELHRRQILPRTGGPYWAMSTLGTMLRNETYAGVWNYNKKIAVEPARPLESVKIRRRLHTSQIYRPRDQWVPVRNVPTIIERELFDAAQMQLTENFNYAKRNRKRFYLLSGIYFCPCGRRLYGVCCNGYLYYSCTGTHRIGPAAPTCREKGVWISKLESAVWLRIIEALKNPCLIFEQMEAIGQTKGKQQATKAIDQKDTERQLQKAVAAEGRLLDAYSAGAIGIEQLRMQLEKIQKTKTDLEGLISKAKESQLSPTVHKPSVTEYCRKIASGLSILEKDPPKQQEFLRSIVDKILVQSGQATIYGAIPAMPQAADEFRISAPSP